MTDLRTLAQAVVDAAELPETNAVVATCHALGDALGIDGLRAEIESAARAILAALNAERAQGYARAMGEVVEQLDSLSDAAVATYQEHRTEYADGVADGSVEAWQAVRKLAERD